MASSRIEKEKRTKDPTRFLGEKRIDFLLDLELNLEGTIEPRHKNELESKHPCSAAARLSFEMLKTTHEAGSKGDRHQATKEILYGGFLLAWIKPS